MAHRKNPHLAAALARAGMTNKDLARTANLHHVTISRVLNWRQTLSPATAERLAHILNCTPHSLQLDGAQKGGGTHG